MVNSLLKLLHIFLSVSDKNLVLGQDNHFNRSSLSILIYLFTW